MPPQTPRRRPGARAGGQQLREPSAQQQQTAERDAVRGADEHELRLVEPEVTPDRGQRHLHDRDREDQDGLHDGQQRVPGSGASVDRSFQFDGAKRF
jgi:hypothetical protein